MTAAKRRILDAALELAQEKRYDTISRGDVASRATVATGSVSYYFSDMDGLRDAVVAEAIAQGCWQVVAQALVDRHPLVVNAAPEVRAGALRALGA